MKNHRTGSRERRKVSPARGWDTICKGTEIFVWNSHIYSHSPGHEGEYKLEGVGMGQILYSLVSHVKEFCSSVQRTEKIIS